MKKKNHDKLRNQYPEQISLDQMYRICGIAKRTAKYLIERGIIPAIDTGKKTWRYRIALEDVIAYLHHRDKVGSMIPYGGTNSRFKGRRNMRISYASFIGQGEKKLISEYFSFIYADYPDVLTTTDIVEMTGLSKRTILQLLKDGAIKSLIAEGKYIVPKPYFLDYVKSQRFIEAKSNSQSFIKILGGFEIWKTAKS